VKPKEKRQSPSSKRGKSKKSGAVRSTPQAIKNSRIETLSNQSVPAGGGVDTNRLNLEVTSLGLPQYSTTKNGRPAIKDLTEAQSSLLDKIIAAHISDQDQFILTDLEANAASLGIKNIVSEDRWKAYCSVQTNLIQALREEAYKSESDSAFFDYQSGGITKEEWLAKRQAVADKFPYPGTYR
jgi:hypothetical protein